MPANVSIPLQWIEGYLSALDRASAMLDPGSQMKALADLRVSFVKDMVQAFLESTNGGR